MYLAISVALEVGQSGVYIFELPFLGNIETNDKGLLTGLVLIAILFILKSVLSVYLRRSTAQYVAKVEVAFTRSLTKDFMSYGFDSTQQGLSDLQHRLSLSVQGIGLYLNSRYTAIAEGSLLFVLIVFLGVVDPFLTILVVLYLGSIALILGKVVRGMIATNSLSISEGNFLLLDRIKDIYGSKSEIILRGSIPFWLDKVVKARESVSLGTASNYSLLSMPRYVLESALISAGTLAVASILYFGNLVAQATTVAVFLAAGLRLLASLVPLQASLNQMTDGMQRGIDAMESLKKLANIDVVTGSKKSEEVVSNLERPFGLEMENLSFHFSSGTPVLKNVSMTVQPGEHAAIVGPSGAGKTTLFKLALGQLESKGAVRVGGVDPKTLISHQPGSVGYVPQESKIVHGTLAENVSLLPSSKTDIHKVKVCLEDAGLSALTGNRIQTVLSPENTNLSGGEIQRLGIARALYGSPGIIFLDEATSALDGETENDISKTLRAYSGKITVITIAHRLSSIRNVDKIFYLDKGGIIASGSFDELRRRSTEFQRAIKNLDIG